MTTILKCWHRSERHNIYYFSYHEDDGRVYYIQTKRALKYSVMNPDGFDASSLDTKYWRYKVLTSLPDDVVLDAI